jgi:uncharacterized UPF0146 family protein
VKVYVLPADRYGCGHYRMIWPADVLRNAGHDVVIMPPNAKSGFLAKFSQDDFGNEHLTSIQVPADADAIVLQRPAHPLQPQMIDIMRSNRIAVIIDMDDDMSTIDPANKAFHLYRPRSSSPLSWKWALESCRRATFVTTSTAQLQKIYAPHGRGLTIDNYVPAAFLGFDKPVTKRFGWGGSVASHPNDPQVAGPAVQRLIDDGHQFVTVGEEKGLRSAFRLRKDPACTGPTDLAAFVQTMAQAFDVGIVPLAATSFNTSKSRLKGIEMSAVGIPWVASPRAEYRRLVQESGGGVLAESPKEWYNHLRRLLTDEVWFKELAEAGRAYMQDQTYEANAWRWLEGWARAVEIERGKGSS